jgi:hypothetical protein
VKPRINWLLRQLDDVPDDLRVEVVYPNARDTTSVLLAQAREDPNRLLYPPDPKREPRRRSTSTVGSSRTSSSGRRVRRSSARVQNPKQCRTHPSQTRRRSSPLINVR